MFSHFGTSCSSPFLLLGIPFAEPPVNDLRLTPPRPKYSLYPLQSFDARNYAPPCLQPLAGTVGSSAFSFPPQILQLFANMTEDCLTLNVFRPSGVDAGSSLPVMVWIYGGGFVCGWRILLSSGELTSFPRWRLLPL